MSLRDRAARYLRMSTDMQRYSFDNQSEAIASYAARNGLTIVESYEDSGRSGLRLKGRPALKQLINDVVSGGANFRVILVYDVSRWGRFQDIDESAYYEFICKEAGVVVEYCAEQFENNNSLTATVIKNLKRAMAGEFSRELSVKVHAGQSRVAAMGFRVGATAGYSLRRFLLDEHGNRKMELTQGQRKSIQTERVILVPGSPEEIKTVHRVYDLFIDHQKSLNAIAKVLNEDGVPNVAGRLWSSISVRELLTNYKYIGTCVYHRTSKKLGVNSQRNPKDEWVTTPGAFEPIVSPERFSQARRQLKENAIHYNDSELLNFLSATWCTKGHLSRNVIDGSEVCPSSNTYKKRFGNLTTAFRKIGFTSPVISNRDGLRRIREGICSEVAAAIRNYGGSAQFYPQSKFLFRVNNEIDVTVALGRTAPSHSRYGHNRWRFGYRSQRKPDILIIARVDHAESSPRDYFFLPYMFLPAGTWLTVSGANYRRLKGFHAASLAPFLQLCTRRPLSSSST